MIINSKYTYENAPESIKKYLDIFKPKSIEEEFFTLGCAVISALFQEDFETVAILDDYFRWCMDNYHGFLTPDNGKNPSIIVFGEFTGFALEDIEKFKKGILKKEDLLKNNLDYFREYFL